MADTLTFKISSALKTILGKELITDDFIAVFELVKNSFDAYAKKVRLIFHDMHGENPRISIVDDGKGMTMEDLMQKWLFVAYSAKKDGSEDILRQKGDYRHKIRESRVYAGAKGIGRFSCDRLGTSLRLITRAPSQPVHCVHINWEDFEVNDKEEFIKIPVEYEEKREAPYGLTHGTVLENSNLRDKWDRPKLLRLKHSLEKLINPEQANDSEGFSISIEAKEEEEADKDETDGRNKVNGRVRNFLFEGLNVKTTQIVTEIAADGRTLTTELIDRGTPIYKVTEYNTYPLLANLKFHLFQLNFASKQLFTKLMGVPPVQYGSVFLYKNGFRVYPFGEEGEDTLGIDRRKQQGHSRFLGTRDLIGRIEINASNPGFQETSSRDGGLIETEAYRQMISCFYDKTLRRLEKYVVDTIRWGDPDKIHNLAPLEPADVKAEIFDIIGKLTNAKEVVSIEYDPEFLDILQNRQQESVAKLLANFTRIAEQTNNNKLKSEAAKARKQLNLLRTAKEEAERETEVAREEEKQSKEALEVERKKNLFLLATARDASPETLGLIHHVKLATTNIHLAIQSFVKQVNKESYTKSDILSFLQRIQLHSSKIQTISNLITRANFSLTANREEGDLAAFIKEYLENKDIRRNDLKIDVVRKKASFSCSFSVLEMSIVLDNLLDNARKARAKTVRVELRDKARNLHCIVSDDGHGVPPGLSKSLFELGISSTLGSGIGLYTVKSLLQEMSAGIKFLGNGRVLKGACFQIVFRNE